MDMCYLACAYRTPSGYCGSTGGAATCPHHKKRTTNADRIRSMSDEELAEFMIGVLCYTKLPYMEVREKALRDNQLLDWLREGADYD